jgi:endonuclease YncB( thermonuclease family)
MSARVCAVCGLPESAHDGTELHRFQESFRPSRLTGLLLMLALVVPVSAQPLAGPARVVDGDTLEVQGQKVRLHGIDAPEMRQVCFRPEYDTAGKESPWACGVAARRQLEELIARRPVTCRALDKDRYGRVIARCFVGSPHIDLGGWLVRNGLAVAYTKYSRDYVPQETAARGERLGIWAGAFTAPGEWRKGKRP